MSLRLSELLRQHPIAITGLGLCGAGGASVAETWDRVLHGPGTADWRIFRDGVRNIRVPACGAVGLEEKVAANPRFRRLDRHIQLAHMAATEAWRDAGWDRVPFDPARAAIVAGTSRGPVTTLIQTVRRQRDERAHANDAPGGAIASLSGALSVAFGLHGPALTVSATCTSSGAALALAGQQILTGAADLVLAGGGEAPLNDLVLAQLHSARVLGKHPDPRLACRPFDTTRDGTVLGKARPSSFSNRSTRRAAAERRSTRCSPVGLWVPKARRGLPSMLPANRSGGSSWKRWRSPICGRPRSAT